MTPDELAAYLSKLPSGFMRVEIKSGTFAMRMEMAPDAWLGAPKPGETGKPEDNIPADVANIRDMFPPEVLAAMGKRQ